MTEDQSTLEMRDGITLTLRHTTSVGDARATMIVVHGISEHSGRWGHVASFFATRGYDVWRFDLRGHGHSGGESMDLLHFDQFVDDLAEVVAHAAGSIPLVIYGHSLGGLITTRHAQSGHRRPAAYVLSAPALGATLPAAQVVAARTLVKVLPTLRLSAPVSGDQLSRDPTVGEAYFADPDVHLKATVRFGVQSIQAMADAVAAVDRIAVPTLVVHGGDDTLVPTAVSSPLAGSAAVERRVYPGLRHEMHNEPEAGDVLGFVAAWLDGVLGFERTY